MLWVVVGRSESLPKRVKAQEDPWVGRYANPDSVPPDGDALGGPAFKSFFLTWGFEAREGGGRVLEEDNKHAGVLRPRR